MNKKNIKIDIYLKEIFYVLNGAILIFAFMEVVKPRLVLAYFNLNYLLILWAFLAIVIVLRKNPKI